MKKKVVIFDLDGTILDTLTDLKNAVNYVLKNYKLKEKTTEEIKSYVGNGIEVLMRKAMPEQIEEVEFQKAFLMFKEYYEANLQNETKPYDGIIELLKELKDDNVVLAVVSNKFQAGVDELVPVFFKDTFKYAVGTSDEIRPKPEIDSIKYLYKELNISKEDDVYFVGDSEVDIKTARNAGIKIISVTWGFRSKESLVDYNPDYLIDEPMEIISIINKKS